MIELSPDDLKVMIRKMAELRRQRVMAWRYQQVMMTRQAAMQRQAAQSAPALAPDTPRKGVNRVTDQTTGSGVPVSTSAGASPDTGELAELHRRLDRQEQLLADVLSRPLTVATSPPASPDTVFQQIALGQRDGASTAPNKEETQRLANEVSRMNIELNSLRRRLADEEDRRRRAELETERALRNSGRSESWENERLRYERDRNRELREEERIRSSTPTPSSATVAPVIIEKEGEIRIIRDTVIIERISTTPVFIPTEGPTDTVIILKETIREIPPTLIKDTVRVDREREVVRTDTLKLKATEPITFPTIFFDNNSSQLNAAHLSLIAGAVNQLNGKSNYTLRLSGFASPSGNAAYNQQLSAKRANAVRQGFENTGFDSDRIVIVSGGIDFKPANAAAARRVEVQALPQ